MQSKNHPQKGSHIKVEPIKTIEDINKLKEYLKFQPRNLAIFNIGLYGCLRASDILKIKIGEVRNLKTGDCLWIKEKKTSKQKCISANKAIYDAVQDLIPTLENQESDAFLFQSEKGGGQICVSHLNFLVKKWCRKIKLKGNYGSHTMRKTAGYMHYHILKTPLPVIMDMLNHSSFKMTYIYLGIQPEDLKEAYMKEF